jgi:hypothetical protein
MKVGARLWLSSLVGPTEQNGVSHAPQEYTALAENARSIDVLLRTLLAIDRALPGPRGAGKACV